MSQLANPGEPVNHTPKANEQARRAQRRRDTNETKVAVSIDLDGTGQCDINTGLPFFDHMLDQLGRHGRFDLQVSCDGDLEIDCHHSVEDTSIVLGQVFAEALGDKAGIRRFASGLYPLDESLAEIAVDISGRPSFHWNADLPVGILFGTPAFDSSMVEHALNSFAINAGITLHVNLRYGTNPHHMIEAIFKGVARCLGDATTVVNDGAIPSTKGVL